MKGQAVLPITMQIFPWIVNGLPVFIQEVLIGGTFLLRPHVSFTLAALLIGVISILEYLEGNTDESADQWERLKLLLQVEWRAMIKLSQIFVSMVAQAVLLAPMPLIFPFRLIYCALCFSTQNVKSAASSIAPLVGRLFGKNVLIKLPETPSIPEGDSCSMKIWRCPAKSQLSNLVKWSLGALKAYLTQGCAFLKLLALFGLQSLSSCLLIRELGVSASSSV